MKRKNFKATRKATRELRECLKNKYLLALLNLNPPKSNWGQLLKKTPITKLSRSSTDALATTQNVQYSNP